MNHDCSTKAVFLCTADKLQSCHILAHWNQHTGPSPLLDQLSFYEVLSTENNPWAGLGRILAVACANVYLCLISREGFPVALHSFGISWPTKYLMTDEITNRTLEVLTDARMLAVWTQHTGPSNILSFSCSMKFFHSKIALGLALGKSCPLFGKR